MCICICVECSLLSSTLVHDSLPVSRFYEVAKSNIKPRTAHTQRNTTQQDTRIIVKLCVELKNLPRVGAHHCVEANLIARSFRSIGGRAASSGFVPVSAASSMDFSGITINDHISPRHAGGSWEAAGSAVQRV